MFQSCEEQLVNNMSQLEISEPFIIQSTQKLKKNQNILKRALSTIEVILKDCKNEEVNTRIGFLEQVLEYWSEHKDVFLIEIIHEQSYKDDSSFISLKENVQRFEEDPVTSAHEIIFPPALVFEENVSDDEPTVKQ